MKSFLILKGATIPQTHNLTRIAQQAQLVGLPQIDINLLSKVQCSAGVRYGEEAIELTDAITAHHASLDIARVLVNCIQNI